jgi:transposase
VITAVVQGGMTQAAAAATYQVSKGSVSKLLARYKAEGEAAFEPRSRRPKSSPTAIPAEVVEEIVRLRKELTGSGLDAGPHTIAWHLEHHHGTQVAAATISRYLTAHGLVTPDPKKKPKSAFLTFQAEQPNECWQSDFTHYRLTRPDGRPGADSEILSWLDDHARYALRLTAHARVTGPIVLESFRGTCAEHGIPASTLTDNGMVFTTRLSGGKRGAATRNGFETELQRLGVEQKNSSPNHPTCATRAGSTPSASAEPTPEPASSCSFRTCTSGSSTPPPANSSASSSSTPPSATNPPDGHPDPHANRNPRTHNRGFGGFRCLETSHSGAEGI